MVLSTRVVSVTISQTARAGGYSKTVMSLMESTNRRKRRVKKKRSRNLTLMLRKELLPRKNSI
jgi:hypothetical protein